MDCCMFAVKRKSVYGIERNAFVFLALRSYSTQRPLSSYPDERQWIGCDVFQKKGKTNKESKKRKTIKHQLRTHFQNILILRILLHISSSFFFYFFIFPFSFLLVLSVFFCCCPPSKPILTDIPSQFRLVILNVACCRFNCR